MSALILCGLFCSGKSSIGERLAKRRGVPFYDTDRMMEADQNKSVKEIYQTLGEKSFREYEASIVKSLKKEPCVIAIGGGALMLKENRDHLKKIGDRVYLKLSLSVLLERLKQRGMPAYLQRWEEAEYLAKVRLPIIETFCNHVFELEGCSIEQCVTHLDRFFGSRLGENKSCYFA